MKLQCYYIYRLTAFIALAVGIWQCAGATYIYAKAVVAQVLLERAWNQSLITHVPAKPWPWADTTSIARLRLKRLGIDQIVLTGDSGRTLAFGPGWSESSVKPGEAGVSVISGHRDTHFSFLRHVEINDEIDVETSTGHFRYRVMERRIVDSTRAMLPLSLPNDSPTLELVTCYPFDAVIPGGPLRYVIKAGPA